MSINELLKRLEGVRGMDGKHYAKCPAHDDQKPSLSVGLGKNGRILLFCHAGCATEDVADALGLTMADLAPSRGQPRSATPTASKGGAVNPTTFTATAQPSGCTVAAYAKVKALPPAFLQKLGVSDISYLGNPAMRIPYRGQDGSEKAAQFRINLGTGENFRWKKGSRPILYGLDKLPDARRAGFTFLVEGPSDTQTLWLHEIPALGLPGATNWNEARDASCFEGIDDIFVVIEPDRGGEAVLAWLAASSIRQRVHLVRLDPYKDASALYLDDPSKFKDRFLDYAYKATPWSDYKAATDDATRKAAWGDCADLAGKDSILDAFIDDLEDMGVAGETKAAKLAFLALVTRHLDHPVPLVFKGPSSGGKSFVVERTLDFFPPAAYYKLTAMSEKALIYSDEPLKNRFLVIYEAVGADHKFVSYLVRSLLSEKHIRYETVEKTKDGQLKTRVISREGPTGLLLTTTSFSLHPENETRMLSVPISDTPKQTARVLQAIAAGKSHTVDVRRWHALDQWLSLGDARVHVPYAHHLAALVPPVAVRLRRDFSTILDLIKAHALLHQETRKRTKDGRVIARLKDYGVVKGLVAGIIAAGVEASVSPIVRETVDAVRTSTKGFRPASLSAVAETLGLDKSTVFRRANAALKLGYLQNLEPRRGRPLQLQVGDPMPEDADLLPTVSALRAAITARRRRSTLRAVS